jgi:uncharacterized protein
MDAEQDRLEQLETLLGNLPDGFEPMLVSEIDGFLTGAIICPDLVPPSAWMPYILGATDDGIFEGMDQVKAIYDAVMQHYNGIVDGLLAGDYFPVCDIDSRNGEVLWPLWADGYGQCLDAFPNGWRTIMRSDNAKLIAAFAGLKRLADLARDEVPPTYPTQSGTKHRTGLPDGCWTSTIGGWSRRIFRSPAPAARWAGTIPALVTRVRNTRNAAV